MALIDNTLFGTEYRVDMAMQRLKSFEQKALQMNPDGYWVAFSGGKDSIVILDLVRKSGVKHTAHFNLTTVDPPELIGFVRENYPDVKREVPTKSMYRLIIYNMMPPTRIARYCCDELKERGGVGRLVVTGIRWAESLQRSKRVMVESCYKHKSKVFLHPIIDWTDADVWEYIKQNNLPYCSLYDEGWKRIGCIGCPMGGTKSMLRQFERWPQFEKMYKRAMVRAMERKKELELRGALKRKLEFMNAEDMFRWWVHGKEATSDQSQIMIFD
ncbi:MAG: phosphoadenosine phosphosulfate reductase family protein [Acidobacteriia bacterium]|nr:phosphoadenosine phosphosulfate reductase family protein [Terriglobia bacterium]